MGRRTILLIAAVVVAALGTSLVFLYVQRADDRATGKTAMVTVLYAASDIEPGSAWQDVSSSGQTYVQQMTADSAPAGAVGAVDQIPPDRVASTKIFKDTPILSQQFGEGAPEASDLGLEATQYAVSVSLGDPQRLANVLKPKQSVVLFLPNGTPLFQVNTAIQVVAIGGSSDAQAPSEQEVGNQALLTLALTLDQVGKVIQNADSLYFALAPSAIVKAPNSATVKP